MAFSIYKRKKAHVKNAKTNQLPGTVILEFKRIEHRLCILAFVVLYALTRANAPPKSPKAVLFWKMQSVISRIAPYLKALTTHQ